MKRNSLTTAVVAGIAGVAGFAGLANAVDLNPDGLGQVLIYPYYTVNKSQDTQFSVVNTSDVGKAVKVRFLEGYNSREVLDFNLYLSAHDVWTGVISTVGDDTTGAQLLTRDHSCLDGIPSGSQQPFLPYGYDGTLENYGQPADDGPQDITRTREGYFEMISMGDIVPGSALEADITHVQTGTPNEGVPPDCASAQGDTPGNLVPPTGGLFGGAAIVDVGVGTFFSYNAEALDGFTSTVLYSLPQQLTPSLQQANDTVATNGVARAYVFEAGGTLLTADYANGRDAVSAVLMADTLYNEYFVDPNLGAASDWVITFPTKRFYVDQDVYPGATIPPFEVPFAGGTSNVTIGTAVYDQEEGAATPSTFNCPSPFNPATCLAQSPILPYEVNVVSFTNTASATSTVFGSNLHKELSPYGIAGWASLDLIGPNAHALPGGTTPAGVAVSLSGLPAVGFYANNVINANAQPGLLANYSGVYRHRASRSCTGADPACS
jgi:hypothetical protein